MKYKLLLLTLLVVILLSACGVSPLASDPLNGTSWKLFAISKHRPIEGSTITIAFEDGQVSGNSGCNSYGSEFQVSGRKIEFGTIWSTVMACADSSLMEQETTFLQHLRNAQRFERSDGQLLIYWSEHEALTFVPVEQRG